MIKMAASGREPHNKQQDKSHKRANSLDGFSRLQIHHSSTLDLELRRRSRKSDEEQAKVKVIGRVLVSGSSPMTMIMAQDAKQEYRSRSRTSNLMSLNKPPTIISGASATEMGPKRTEANKNRSDHRGNKKPSLVSASIRWLVATMVLAAALTAMASEDTGGGLQLAPVRSPEYVNGDQDLLAQLLHSTGTLDEANRLLESLISGAAAKTTDELASAVEADFSRVRAGTADSGAPVKISLPEPLAGAQLELAGNKQGAQLGLLDQVIEASAKIPERNPNFEVYYDEDQSAFDHPRRLPLGVEQATNVLKNSKQIENLLAPPLPVASQTATTPSPNGLQVVNASESMKSASSQNQLSKWVPREPLGNNESVASLQIEAASDFPNAKLIANYSHWIIHERPSAKSLGLETSKLYNLEPSSAIHFVAPPPSLTTERAQQETQLPVETHEPASRSATKTRKLEASYLQDLRLESMTAASPSDEFLPVSSRHDPIRIRPLVRQTNSSEGQQEVRQQIQSELSTPEMVRPTEPTSIATTETTREPLNSLSSASDQMGVSSESLKGQSEYTIVDSPTINQTISALVANSRRTLGKKNRTRKKSTTNDRKRLVRLDLRSKPRNLNRTSARQKQRERESLQPTSTTLSPITESWTPIETTTQQLVRNQQTKTKQRSVNKTKKKLIGNTKRGAKKKLRVAPRSSTTTKATTTSEVAATSELPTTTQAVYLQTEMPRIFSTLIEPTTFTHELSSVSQAAWRPTLESTTSQILEFGPTEASVAPSSSTSQASDSHEQLPTATPTEAIVDLNRLAQPTVADQQQVAWTSAPLNELSISHVDQKPTEMHAPPEREPQETRTRSQPEAASSSPIELNVNAEPVGQTEQPAGEMRPSVSSEASQTAWQHPHVERPKTIHHFEPQIAAITASDAKIDEPPIKVKGNFGKRLIGDPPRRSTTDAEPSSSDAWLATSVTPTPMMRATTNMVQPTDEVDLGGPLVVPQRQPTSTTSGTTQSTTPIIDETTPRRWLRATGPVKLTITRRPRVPTSGWTPMTSITLRMSSTTSAPTTTTTRTSPTLNPVTHPYFTFDYQTKATKQPNRWPSVGDQMGALEFEARNRDNGEGEGGNNSSRSLAVGKLMLGLLKLAAESQSLASKLNSAPAKDRRPVGSLDLPTQFMANQATNYINGHQQSQSPRRSMLVEQQRNDYHYQRRPSTDSPSVQSNGRPDNGPNLPLEQRAVTTDTPPVTPTTGDVTRDEQSASLLAITTGVGPDAHQVQLAGERDAVTVVAGPQVKAWQPPDELVQAQQPSSTSRPPARRRFPIQFQIKAREGETSSGQPVARPTVKPEQVPDFDLVENLPIRSTERHDPIGSEEPHNSAAPIEDQGRAKSLHVYVRPLEEMAAPLPAVQSATTTTTSQPATTQTKRKRRREPPGLPPATPASSPVQQSSTSSTENLMSASGSISLGNLFKRLPQVPFSDSSLDGPATEPSNGSYNRYSGEALDSSLADAKLKSNRGVIYEQIGSGEDESFSSNTTTIQVTQQPAIPLLDDYRSKSLVKTLISIGVPTGGSNQSHAFGQEAQLTRRGEQQIRMVKINRSTSEATSSSTEPPASQRPSRWQTPNGSLQSPMPVSERKQATEQVKLQVAKRLELARPNEKSPDSSYPVEQPLNNYLAEASPTTPTAIKTLATTGTSADPMLTSGDETSTKNVVFSTKMRTKPMASTIPATTPTTSVATSSQPTNEQSTGGSTRVTYDDNHETTGGTTSSPVTPTSTTTTTEAATTTSSSAQLEDDSSLAHPFGTRPSGQLRNQRHSPARPTEQPAKPVGVARQMSALQRLAIWTVAACCGVLVACLAVVAISIKCQAACDANQSKMRPQNGQVGPMMVARGNRRRNKATRRNKRSASPEEQLDVRRAADFGCAISVSDDSASSLNVSSGSDFPLSPNSDRRRAKHQGHAHHERPPQSQRPKGMSLRQKVSGTITSRLLRIHLPRLLPAYLPSVVNGESQTTSAQCKSHDPMPQFNVSHLFASQSTDEEQPDPEPRQNFHLCSGSRQRPEARAPVAARCPCTNCADPWQLPVAPRQRDATTGTTSGVSLGGRNGVKLPFGAGSSVLRQESSLLPPGHRPAASGCCAANGSSGSQTDSISQMDNEHHLLISDGQSLSQFKAAAVRRPQLCHGDQWMAEPRRAPRLTGSAVPEETEPEVDSYEQGNVRSQCRAGRAQDQRQRPTERLSSFKGQSFVADGKDLRGCLGSHKAHHQQAQQTSGEHSDHHSAATSYQECNCNLVMYPL